MKRLTLDAGRMTLPRCNTAIPLPAWRLLP